MAQTVKFEKFGEYIQFNIEFINSNPLQNFFLSENVKAVLQKQVAVNTFFNVIDESGTFIVVLKVEGLCLVYSKQISDAGIRIISENLQFHRFQKFQFAGTRAVLEALFKFNNVTDINIQKSRNFYECSSVVENFRYSPGELEMADPARLNELSILSVKFAKEYDGTILEPFKAQMNIISSIQESCMYQWVWKKKICAIAQVLYEESNCPVIGHVYVVLEFRQMGYAGSIVHAITKGLLEAGNSSCQLATNANNQASNQAFINVGYKKIGDYLLAYKRS